LRNARLHRGQMIIPCASMSLHMMAMLPLAPTLSFARKGHNTVAAILPRSGDNSSINLSKGFCAAVFANHIGYARQMLVRSGPRELPPVASSFTLMNRGSYLINTACSALCNRDTVVRALNSGKLAGYAGDVWYPQSAAHLRHLALGSGALRRGHAGDIAALLQRAPDTVRISDRRRWQTRGDRCKFLQARLEHDPEKWISVFQKDRAQINR
jgi:D-isomer specific 2-hydroxyacid dehydrogenase, NAD binding domain